MGIKSFDKRYEGRQFAAPAGRGSSPAEGLNQKAGTEKNNEGNLTEELKKKIEQARAMLVHIKKRLTNRRNKEGFTNQKDASESSPAYKKILSLLGSVEYRLQKIESGDSEGDRFEQILKLGEELREARKAFKHEISDAGTPQAPSGEGNDGIASDLETLVGDVEGFTEGTTSVAEDDENPAYTALQEAQENAAETSVETYLETRKEELIDFKNSLAEFIKTHPDSADSIGIKVLQDSLLKTEGLVDGATGEGPASVLRELVSDLGSLQEQLRFIEEGYLAFEQIADTRHRLQERMQEPYAIDDETLLSMSRELFDLLGENETNLEAYTLNSPQVQETNDKYVKILDQFDVRYEKLQYESSEKDRIHRQMLEGEQHVPQEKVKREKYLASFERMQSTINERYAMHESVPYMTIAQVEQRGVLTLLRDTLYEVEDKFGVSSVEFSESYREYLVAYETFIEETEAVYQEKNEREIKEKAYNELSLEGKQDANNEMISVGITSLREFVSKSLILNEVKKLELLEQLESMQSDALSLTGNEFANEDNVLQAKQNWEEGSAEILRILQGDGMKERKKPTEDPEGGKPEADSAQKIAAMEAAIAGMNADVAKGPVLSAFTSEKKGWKRKFIHFGSEVLNKLTVSVASAGVLYAAMSAEVPDATVAKNAPPTAVTSTNEAAPVVTDDLGIDVMHLTKQPSPVSETSDSIPMTDVSSLSSEIDSVSDVELNAQPIEFTFEKGNRINTLSEALEHVWKQNSDVLEKNVAHSAFQVAMWSVIADMEKNQQQEDTLGLAMGLEKHNGAYDIGHVHPGHTHKVDLRAFYQLMNERL